MVCACLIQERRKKSMWREMDEEKIGGWLRQAPGKWAAQIFCVKRLQGEWHKRTVCPAENRKIFSLKKRGLPVKKEADYRALYEQSLRDCQD